ncbi:MAG: AMP-binding protein [Cyanobacteria bacterium]|nr:AMP-binding protein [Cyanobacteriota bacterium]
MTTAEPLLLALSGEPAAGAAALQKAWSQGRVVALAGPGEQERLAEALRRHGSAAALGQSLAAGVPAVLLGSGGSAGERRWCLQPLRHLQASAAASARWLAARGLDPAACLHLNPLPLHHVSGLLPLLRARHSGGQVRWLAPALLRQPAALQEAMPLPPDRPAVLSLVPTQLARLLAEPAGVAWLRGCAVIWVGGAALPAELARQARAEGLPLAPCYGATETAAMVCALPPQRFLAGEQGCGPALDDVALQLAASDGAVEVRCSRLALGWLEAGGLRPLPRSPEGWWRSGDAGRLGAAGLEVLGRLDGAISSGGETVFPEQLEARLRAQARAQGLPLEAVLLLGVDDALWGQRLVALVRAQAGADAAALVAALQQLVAGWPAAERPQTWWPCPELAPSEAGKWQRGRWRDWWRER